jgi:hypothetical protein
MEAIARARREALSARARQAQTTIGEEKSASISAGAKRALGYIFEVLT